MRRVILLLFAAFLSFVIWRIFAMKMKAGVDLAGVSWRMFVASIIIEPVFVLNGSDLTITAGVDGTHMAKSKHYEGLALDYRTRDLAADKVPTVAAQCLTLLAPLGYDVVLEGDHLHVEYDPKT